MREFLKNYIFMYEHVTIPLPARLSTMFLNKLCLYIDQI